MKKSRYFIVFYAAFHQRLAKYLHLNAAIITDGAFINNNSARDRIAETLDDIERHQITITSILELNKEDYNEFIK